MYLHELGEADASFTKEDMQLGYVCVDLWLHYKDVLISQIYEISQIHEDSKEGW